MSAEEDPKPDGWQDKRSLVNIQNDDDDDEVDEDDDDYGYDQYGVFEGKVFLGGSV